MKTGDMSSGAGRLRHSLKLLRLRWEETKEVWNDVKRREFEEQHLEPLEPQVQATLEKIDRLAQVFLQAQQECS